MRRIECFVLFLLINAACSSVLLDVTNISLACNQSLKGANITVTLNIYTNTIPEVIVFYRESFYNRTSDYYTARSEEAANFTISDNMTVILMKADVTYEVFDGHLVTYEGHGNILSLTECNWNGTNNGTLNVSLSDPTSSSLQKLNFTWFIGLSYTREECAAGFYGFTCSQRCKQLNECSECDQITGECWSDKVTTALSTSTSDSVSRSREASSTTVNSIMMTTYFNHETLYFWLVIGLAVLCLVLVLLLVFAIISAAYFYRHSPQSEKRTVETTVESSSYWPHYASRSELPTKNAHPASNVDCSITSTATDVNESSDSWPTKVKHREARV